MSGPPTTIVTGALGFVARWLIADLLTGGEQVVGVGLLPEDGQPPAKLGAFRLDESGQQSPGTLQYRGQAGAWTYVPCALEKPGAFAEILDGMNCRAIYHLAAQSSAGYSFQDPQTTLEFNIHGTLNLLEAVRALPEAARPTVLSTGSCEEYGAQGRQRRPLAERTPLEPVSPYGVSKATQSLLAVQYHRSFGLPVIVTRAFSHTGPEQDTRFAFPSFAWQIVEAEMGRREPVLAVGNLSPVRDYLDVRDVVRAYRLLIAKGEPGQVYNVCSGLALTMGEGVEILRQGARCQIEIRPDPARQRPSDIPYMVGDGTKLRQRTGWRPEHSIADTLQETLIWAREEMS
jgi:GDP-4-dehydro-6-deoxy-D-mannose reductase